MTDLVYFHNGVPTSLLQIRDDLEIHSTPPWAIEWYLRTAVPYQAALFDEEPWPIHMITKGPNKGTSVERKELPNGKYAYRPVGSHSSHPGVDSPDVAAAASKTATGEQVAPDPAVLQQLAHAEAHAKGQADLKSGALRPKVGLGQAIEEILNGTVGGPKAVPQAGKAAAESVAISMKHGVAEHILGGGGATHTIGSYLKDMALGGDDHDHRTFNDAIRGSTANALHSMSKVFAAAGPWIASAANLPTEFVHFGLQRAIDFAGARAPGSVAHRLTSFLDKSVKEHHARLTQKYGPTVANTIVGAGHMVAAGAAVGAAGVALAASPVWMSAFGATSAALSVAAATKVSLGLAGFALAAQRVPIIGAIAQAPGLAAYHALSWLGKKAGLGKTPGTGTAAMSATFARLSEATFKKEALKTWADTTASGMIDLMGDEHVNKLMVGLGSAIRKDPDSFSSRMKKAASFSGTALYNGLVVPAPAARAYLSSQGLSPADIEARLASMVVS